MSVVYGHRDRYDVVCETRMPGTGEVVVDYLQGLGGRIFDLPREYQDAAAEALRDAHPRAINRRVLLYALVSDRYARSRHPLLVDLDEEQTRIFSRRWEDSARSHARYKRGQHLIQ